MAKLKVTPSPHVVVSQNSLVIDQHGEADLEVDTKQLSLRKFDALRIKVVDDDGRPCFFWVTVGMGRQNRPIVEVSTPGTGQTSRKFVRGTFKKKTGPATRD